MVDWQLWLIVAAVLGIAELFTLTAALGILGGAALVTAGSATVGLPPVLQLVVFAVSATLGLVLLRPVVHRHLHQPQLQRFGVDALIGKPARVIREVSATDGLVRVGGEEWTARAAYDDTLVIPAGAVVDVMEISGSTALVYPRE